VTSLREGEAHHVLVRALDALEAVPVLLELAAEVLQPLKGLLLLRLHGLLFGEPAIVVDGARERGEGRIELRLQMRRGRCGVGELVEVLPYRRGLPQGVVEEGVLRAM
jgi:hypothetical protein